MNINDVTLVDLAISTGVYNLTAFNDSLGDLREATKNRLDLDIAN